jgi:hypothetical protein
MSAARLPADPARSCVAQASPRLIGGKPCGRIMVGWCLLPVMGGTALSVLSPCTAEDVEPVLLEEMATEGLGRYERDPNYWLSADGLPYAYDLQAPDVEVDVEELQLIAQAVGAVMRCDIVLHILVSSLAGRPALARIAQRVARRTEGWVFVEFGTAPSADLVEYLVNAGHCVRVDDSFYLDASAMAAWIAHPDFHVVK